MVELTYIIKRTVYKTTTKVFRIMSEFKVEYFVLTKSVSSAIEEG